MFRMPTINSSSPLFSVGGVGYRRSWTPTRYSTSLVYYEYAFQALADSTWLTFGETGLESTI